MRPQVWFLKVMVLIMEKINKIAILGAGNLGISIATGIVEKGLKLSSDIFLTRRHINFRWV